MTGYTSHNGAKRGVCVEKHEVRVVRSLKQVSASSAQFWKVGTTLPALWVVSYSIGVKEEEYSPI